MRQLRQRNRRSDFAPTLSTKQSVFAASLITQRRPIPRRNRSTSHRTVDRPYFFNKFAPLTDQTSDTEEDEDSDEDESAPTQINPASAQAQINPASAQAQINPASAQAQINPARAQPRTKPTETRLRPYQRRDFTSSYHAIPIAGENDSDKDSAASWESDKKWDDRDDNDENNTRHYTDYDGNIKAHFESSSEPLHRLSKGQRQRRNRSLRKAKEAKEKADLDRTIRLQLRDGHPQPTPLPELPFRVHTVPSNLPSRPKPFHPFILALHG